MVFQWDLKLSVLILCPLRRVSGASQGQPLPLPCLGSFDMSYKVICRWLSLVLGMEEAMLQTGWLPLAPGLG